MLLRINWRMITLRALIFAVSSFCEKNFKVFFGFSGVLISAKKPASNIFQKSSLTNFGRRIIYCSKIINFYGNLMLPISRIDRFLIIFVETNFWEINRSWKNLPALVPAKINFLKVVDGMLLIAFSSVWWSKRHWCFGNWWENCQHYVGHTSMSRPWGHSLFLYLLHWFGKQRPKLRMERPRSLRWQEFHYSFEYYSRCPVQSIYGTV